MFCGMVARAGGIGVRVGSQRYTSDLSPQGCRRFLNVVLEFGDAFNIISIRSHRVDIERREFYLASTYP